MPGIAAAAGSASISRSSSSGILRIRRRCSAVIQGARRVATDVPSFTASISGSRPIRPGPGVARDPIVIDLSPVLPPVPAAGGIARIATTTATNAEANAAPAIAQALGLPIGQSRPTPHTTSPTPIRPSSPKSRPVRVSARTVSSESGASRGRVRAISDAEMTRRAILRTGLGWPDSAIWATPQSDCLPPAMLR